MKRWIRCAIQYLVLVSISVCAVTTSRAELQAVTSVEGITEYRLDNGLQVLIFPDPSKSTFTVNITYRVGSRHEGRGEAGMAHLLEHMVFKGTPEYPSIWGALEKYGANFNGTTSIDRTNYFETLSSSPENLEFAIDMEADRMVNSFIDGEELAREMTVVRNEFERTENSPGAILSQRMMSSAFLWHNYGKSTIGNRSDIERVPVENLRKFYKKYYQPDNATLIIAGNFDTENALRLIEEKFGAIPRPERVLEASYTEEPTQDGPRFVELERAGDVAVAGLLYHIPAGVHEDFVAVDILADSFVLQPSGRLYRQLVSPGKASSVSGGARMCAEPGVVQFTARVAEGEDPQNLLDYMTNIVESAIVDGITEKEVERAKARSAKSIKLAMASSSTVGIYLSEFIAQGDWRLFFIYRDRINDVTVDDVRRVAKKYFVESNRTGGLFIPTDDAIRATIPASPDVEKLVEGYKGSEQISEGEEVDAEVASIEARTIRETLPSGIKVAFLPMEKRGDAVWLSFRLHYGTEEALTGSTTAAGLMPMLMNRGTKNKTYQELQDAIDALQSRIRVGGRGGGDAGQISASIQSDRENVVPSIALLAEMLKQPSFDEKEFKIIQKMMASFLEQGKSNPQVLGMMALTRKLQPYPEDSIHYIPTIEESIERIEGVTAESIREIYENYVGGSHMEIAVVGDFNVDEVRDALNSSLGDWKSPSPYTRIEKPFIEPAKEALRIETPDKEMAVVGLGTGMPLRDSDERYPALRMANYVLGGNPKSRLMTRLRHEGGLSYGTSSSITASSREERGTFNGTAICAPQNADEALTGLREELQSLVASGITEEELAEAKKSIALKYKSRLTSERYLLRQLVSGLDLDRTLEFQDKIQQRMQTLTVDDVKAALNSVFPDVSMVEVMAGDLAGASESDDEEESAKPAASAAAVNAEHAEPVPAGAR